MNREDLELYVTGNFDGDVTALEREIADDPAVAAAVADEARFEMLLRDATAAATFCVACEEIVRGERCDACGAAVRPGGYVIERVLVSNAHGRMYVAHDADGKQVALKELAFVQAPSQSTIDAFEREAKFLRALEHPAIPRFVASFEEGRGVHTRYYLAQELVDGTTLDRIEQRWYTEAEIVDVARHVLGILVYLQSLSPMIVHRDVKPANLVRRADGSIALVDFGAAYVDGATAGMTTVGTFGYMPVEQLAGIVDATTDLYALGASLMYLLTRQEPWRLAQTKTTVNVAAPLRAYLDKLTATDPRERFASAKEALAMLDRREELVKSVSKPKRSRAYHAVWIATGIAVMGAGVGVGVAMRKSRLEEQKKAAAVTTEMATLRVVLPKGIEAALYIDEQRFGTVRNGLEVPVPAGLRDLKISSGAARCEQKMRLPAGKITTIECIIGVVEPSPRLDNKTSVTWSFKSTPF
nr:serine/threonine protein kinase [Deltaproteobacteria bacterium]